MKHLKMLGLAVVAAAALMAIVGAGTASATTICKTNTTPCSGGNYPANTTFHATLKSGTKATIAMGFSTIVCEEVTFHFETTSAGGGAGVSVAFKILGLSIGKCGAASFKALLVGSGSVAYTSGMSGSLTGNGTELEILLGTTKCYYGGEITEGRIVEGGATATGKETNVKLVRQAGSSALCVNPAKWNAEYVYDGETSTAYVSES